jgi:hypothetical protein
MYFSAGVTFIDLFVRNNLMKLASSLSWVVLCLLFAAGSVGAQLNSIQLRTAGTNSTTLKAASSGGNLTLTFPSSAGSTGQALTTDGSGNLSWASAASSIDALTDGKSGGTSFTSSLILGHETTGTLVGSDGAVANVAVGYETMKAITTGDDNVLLGYNAGSTLTIGSTNTMVGSGSGTSLVSGSGNVFVGYQAGALETGSNKLYIDNSNTATPLIGGDFSANTLTLTGSVTTTGTSKYSAATGTATTANTSTGAGAQDLAAFTGTYEKVAVTATTSAGYVQLPTGTAGQVVYLQLTFTANGSNTVTVVNSDNNNTDMVYDGTGADIIVAHMIYTTEEGWVIFSAIEYDN